MEKRIAVPTAGAGVGIRAVATIIDVFVLTVFTYILLILCGNTTANGIELQGLPYFYSLLLGMTYYTLLEGTIGATPGKLVLGLRVVKTNGYPCDMKAAIIRTVCRLVDGFGGYLVGALIVWFSTRNQRLGDQVAETIVLKIK
ncbi:MAG TPA: RDD family protein [Methylomusa anaerophila]|uniref:RDD family protein n=1 Tax=Methylomusa anaerophila TaxID=1930071 RepID=A0A348AFZ5_9FIRM|nr:RDD family protein [Methylomusa anaerophila]BBB89993.1 RDD family protein [Methylomusa anaerophila]HML88278.1 RDD family protein [Methylomusa anaerophila]